MKLLLLSSDMETMIDLAKCSHHHRWQLEVVSSIAELEAIEDQITPNLILIEQSFLATEPGRRLRALRENWQVPALLTVSQEELPHLSERTLHEFDDFISLPCAFDELLVRIRMLLHERQDEGDELQFGPLLADRKTLQVSMAGEWLALTPKQFELLYLLMEQQGALLANETIYERIWPESRRVAASDVQQFIYHLRRSLRELAEDQVVIENVRGVGYRLVASVAAGG